MQLTPQTVFLIATYGILPFWLLLAFAPKWHLTQTLVHSALFPIVIGAAYTTYVATGALSQGDGFATLDALMKTFTIPEAVLAGWLHYLVFDLFVGAWQVRDAKRRGMNHWLVVPCLFFTLMLGPVGLLLYIILRKLTGKGGWALEADTV
ncbi:MAG: ABA4-like family protein [Parvibaculum sp.]